MAGASPLAGLRANVASYYASGEMRTEDRRTIEVHPHSTPAELGGSIRDLAVAEGATRTLETGLALGFSALFLCDALLQSGHSEARHIAIDPMQRSVWGSAGLLAIQDCGVAHLVEFHEAESQLVLPVLAQAGRQIDMAFVDGDHRFESAFVDLYFIDRMLRPGGVVVVDDMYLPPVRLAAAYFEANLGYKLEPDLLPDGFRWVQPRKGWRPVLREGRGRAGVFRKPLSPPIRNWDSFTPFVVYEWSRSPIDLAKGALRRLRGE